MIEKTGNESCPDGASETSLSELIKRVDLLEKENDELKKVLAKKSKKKSKAVRFTVRTIEEDYELIKEKAEAVRRPVSSFLIKAGLDKKIMLPEDATAYRNEISATTIELKKIGNNLNQAVHLAHIENRFVEAGSLEKIIAEVGRVIERAKKHL